MLEDDEDKELNKNYETGVLINNIIIEEAAITKYFDPKKYRLSSIIFYYLRKKYLVSIQYIYQDISNPSFYTPPLEKKYFGIDPHNINNNKINIDLINEIVLKLDEDEDIYQIKGYYDYSSKKLITLSIFTTQGQFVEIGVENTELKNIFNFKWFFVYNDSYFNGFIVGWTQSEITYLASLVTNNSNKKIEKEIKDITNEIKPSLIYNENFIEQSKIYGKYIENQTIFYDPYLNDSFDILKNIIENNIRLNKIVISINSNKISKIKLEYIFNENKKIYEVKYVFKNFEEGSEEMELELSDDDYINKFYFSHEDMNIDGIGFKSFKQKKLGFNMKNMKHIQSIESSDTNQNLCLCGLVVGYYDKIHLLQYYYTVKSNR